MRGQLPAWQTRDASGDGLWVSYAPVTTGFTLGASTVSARWRRIGDDGAYRIRIVLGTGFALPTGATFSFPFALRAESQMAGADLKVLDAGTANYRLIGHQNASNVSIWGEGAAGIYSGSWPFALAAGDIFIIAGGGDIQP